MCRGYRERSDFWIILFENAVVLAKRALKCATTKRHKYFRGLGSASYAPCSPVNPRVARSCPDILRAITLEGESKDKLMAPWQHN